MALSLSRGAISSQGSDIGVTPVYKNEKRRAYWWKKGGRKKRDCGRGLGEAKKGRGRYGKGHAEVTEKNTYTFLAWLHPRRIHPHLVLASCRVRATHRATSRPAFSASFNKFTPRDRDGINTAAALLSYAHILRCASLGNSPSQSPPTSLLFLILPSPIL